MQLNSDVFSSVKFYTRKMLHTSETSPFPNFSNFFL